MGRPLLLLLRSEGWEARWLGVSLALTAAACGDAVRLALFEGPLRAFAGGRFDEGAPPTAAASKVGSLAQMLEEGRAELGLRLVACDTAVRLAGLDPEALAPRLEVTSLTALWREADGGRVITI
jgi:hypothetical protein